MSRESHFERRNSGWQSLAMAGGIAMVIALMLIGGVGIIWIVGGGSAGVSPSIAQAPQTPTPRALSFVRITPTPQLAPRPTSTPIMTVEEAGEVSLPATVVATPELLAMRGDSNAAAKDSAILNANRPADFVALASDSWAASGDALVNDGSHAMSERWLTLAEVPSPDFAVEAEMRVTLLLDTVCDQSFGLVGGSPGSRQIYGGGILFPCSGGGDQARLTDVSDWEDGYNADPVIADNRFDPSDGWHTYRFELHNGQTRLIIDGVGIVSGTTGAPIDSSVTDAEAGIWSQGVGLEVRRVAVYPLPTG